MRTRNTAILVVVSLAANAAILWWRLLHPSDRAIVELHSSVPLPEAQAKAVLHWTQAATVDLSDDAIDRYAQNLHWSDCIPCPANAEIVRIGSVPDAKTDFEKAFSGLLRTYAKGDPKDLLAYMSERGQRIPAAVIDELREILGRETHAEQVALKAMDDRNVFLSFAKLIEFAPHWNGLVEDSGCATIWKLRGGVKTASGSLGQDAVDLFKNQTRFNQLFVDPSVGPATDSTPTYRLFVDVRFVIRHDAKMIDEPSPYYVRFGYNEAIKKWQPLDMIHVPTIAGISPVLLF